MASTTDSSPNALTSLIDTAVSRGIIDARQRDQLHALAGELAPLVTQICSADKSSPKWRL